MNILSTAAAWFKAGLVGVALVAAAVSCGGGSAHRVKTPQPQSAFIATSLVSDGSQPAAYTDPNLVNAWGLAFDPTGFAWVADNGTSSATQYDGNGVPQSLVVSIPPGTLADARPTGIVYNGTQDFKVTENGVTGASLFIFVGEGSVVAGWSPTVDATSAVIAVDAGADGPLYKGLALASLGGFNFLYAADFRNNAVDVYNGGFTKVRLAGSFSDPALPAGYAPFGIQAIGDRIYVSYALQSLGGPGEVHGEGLGIVNVFDRGGVFIMRLATGGALNAPWGMAMAPADFGSFSNSLLVANFGDGKINAFDPSSGTLIGTLSKSDGTPLVLDGLWGIAFGNGTNAQPTNTLFFTAGPANELHGLYGRIDM
jgi:uncharacterized protein (TIGR03118 family)